MARAARLDQYRAVHHLQWSAAWEGNQSINFVQLPEREAAVSKAFYDRVDVLAAELGSVYKIAQQFETGKLKHQINHDVLYRLLRGRATLRPSIETLAKFYLHFPRQFPELKDFAKVWQAYELNFPARKRSPRQKPLGAGTLTRRSSRRRTASSDRRRRLMR